MASKRDYYEILGVSKTADDGEIKKAYRKLAMEHHPDRNPGDKAAEERFKEAAEAYEVLSDPDKRPHYDRFGHEGVRQAGFQGFSGVEDIFSHFGDLFGDLFGGAGGRGRGGGAGRGRGADLRLDLELSFLEAVTGVTKEVQIKRRVACETCSGSGAKAGTKAERCGTCNGRGQVLHQQGFFMIGATCPACRGEGSVVKDPCTDCRGAGTKEKAETLSVNVPAGIDDSQTLRLAGRGEAGPRGGTAGHLYVVLHVTEDERFQRDGADVYVEAPISIVTATLGGKAKIPTLPEAGDDGKVGEAELDVPAGTQPETIVVRRGEGITRVESHGRGDQYVKFRVVVPTKLDEKQRELMKALAAELGEEIRTPSHHEKRGFFGKKKRK